MSSLPIQRPRERTAEQIRAEDAGRVQRLHRSALEQRRAQFARPILTVSIRDGVQFNRLDQISRR